VPRATRNIALFIPLVALALRFGSSDLANVSYLVLAGYALLGPEQVLQALALSWLFSMLSEGVAPVATEAAVGRYAVVLAAAVTLFLRSGWLKDWFSMSRPMLATLALGAFLIIHSVMFSVLPDISIFKALFWTTVMATLLSAWFGLDFEARGRVERHLFVGLILVVLVSVPLAFMSTGYLVNGSGFQGVLSHPQTFGLAVAMLGAWLAGRLLSTESMRWQDLALFGLCLVFVVLSEARTAGYSLAFGLTSTVLFLSLIARDSAWHLMPGLASRWLHALTVVAAMGAVFAGPVLSGLVSDYISKRTDKYDLLDAAEQSRGALVEAMLSNVEEKPLTGIGFGIASDFSSMVVVRHPVFEFPLSAPIEKGVLPIAVLEELGVFGLFTVATWIWLMVKRAAQTGVVAFAVVAVLLFTNLGESVLFAPSGAGLLELILLAWAATGAFQLFENRSNV
jgi:hypothetical protein